MCMPLHREFYINPQEKVDHATQSISEFNEIGLVIKSELTFCSSLFASQQTNKKITKRRMVVFIFITYQK